MLKSFTAKKTEKKPLQIRKRMYKDKKQDIETQTNKIDTHEVYQAFLKQEHEEKENEQNIESYSQPTNIVCNITAFDSTVKMSDNPFDVFSKTTLKIVEKNKSNELRKPTKTTDEQLLNVLKQNKIHQIATKIELKEGIFKSLNILSRNELFIAPKKYYKFPFDMALVNDDSEIFHKLRSTFMSALSSVYLNYKKFGESFSVALFNDIFVFSNKLKCTKGLKKLLNQNEIDFIEMDTHLVIEDLDIGLVHDIIMNTEIPDGKTLPFILSEYEFENGIVYRTKLNKGTAVKVKQNIEYSYLLEGPLYSTHFNLEPESILEYNN